MSRDPLGLWGDPAQRGNGQSYCGNDPVNLVDPFGDLSPSHGPGKELGDLGPGGRSGPELRWDVWKMLEKVREAADEDPSLAQLILEITTVLIAEGLIGLGAETIGKIPALIAELLQSEGGCDVGLAIVGRIPGVSAGKRAGRAAKIVAELVERYREAKKRFRSRVRSSGAPQGPPASGPPTAPPPSTPPPSGPPGGGGPPPTPPSGGPPSAPPPTPGTPGDPDFENQKALRDLVNSETNRGHKPLSREDAETVLDWADEVDYPGRRASPGDVGFPSNWNGGMGQPHIHLPGAGRGGHVPVDPGVQPR